MSDLIPVDALGRIAQSILTDRITGTDGPDTLQGGNGPDTIFAGRGDDTLLISPGTDTLYGGPGDDTYVLRPLSADFLYIIVEGKDAGYDTVVLGTDQFRFSIPGNVEEVRIEAEVETFFGNANANAIDASAATDSMTVFARGGADTVTGTSGNDVIDGGRGGDLMTGGAGWDVYFVNSSKDMVVEEASGGAGDLIISSVSYTLPDHVEFLELTDDAKRGTAGEGDQVLIGNSVRNVLSGGAGEDQLFGGDARDTLKGGADNDVLTGGAGRDALTGGQGADTFIWTTHTETGKSRKTADRIKDLGDGDIIDLSAVDGMAGAPGSQAFTYIDNDAFSGTAGELRFDNGWLRGDRDGDGRTDFWIKTGDADLALVTDALLL